MKKSLPKSMQVLRLNAGESGKLKSLSGVLQASRQTIVCLNHAETSMPERMHVLRWKSGEGKKLCLLPGMLQAFQTALIETSESFPEHQILTIETSMPERMKVLRLKAGEGVKFNSRVACFARGACQDGSINLRTTNPHTETAMAETANPQHTLKRVQVLRLKAGEGEKLNSLPAVLKASRKALSETLPFLASQIHPLHLQVTPNPQPLHPFMRTRHCAYWPNQHWLNQN